MRYPGLPLTEPFDGKTARSGPALGRWAILAVQGMARRQTGHGRTREYFTPRSLRSLPDFAAIFRYDSCDVGTFPNQTLKDGSGPAAALHTDFGSTKYNKELSWLSGQKLS